MLDVTGFHSNYFRKNLDLRCLTLLPMRLWKQWLRRILSIEILSQGIIHLTSLQRLTLYFSSQLVLGF